MTLAHGDWRDNDDAAVQSGARWSGIQEKAVEPPQSITRLTQQTPNVERAPVDAKVQVAPRVFLPSEGSRATGLIVGAALLLALSFVGYWGGTWLGDTTRSSYGSEISERDVQRHANIVPAVVDDGR
jgi:hypothetical protein